MLKYSSSTFNTIINDTGQVHTSVKNDSGSSSLPRYTLQLVDGKEQLPPRINMFITHVPLTVMLLRLKLGPADPDDPLTLV
jgi:hypothetical protein